MATLLDFLEQRSILARARRGFGDRPRRAVTSREGLSISARTLVTAEERRLIEDNRTLAASLNRVLENLGKRWVAAVQKRIRELGAIKSRLFISSWRAVRFKDRSTVNNAVRLTNAAPYALYVHPKGTPKTRTIVNYDIRRELLPQFAEQMVEDFDRILRPQLAKALRARILAEAAR